MIFHQMKLLTSEGLIPQFHVVLIELTIFEIILIIHLQGQKVNFKAK